MPETAGVNVTFTARKNGYENLELDKLTWMSYSTSKFVNQADLLANGATTIPVSFTYDSYVTLVDGSLSDKEIKTVNIELSNQETIRTLIRNYYVNYLAYLDNTGTYSVKKNITEKNLTDYTSYIWHIAINEVYSQLYAQYKYYGDRGETEMKLSIYNLMETLKTWHFYNGQLEFVDTDFVRSLETSPSLFNYFVYVIEYIKLVRNILNPYVAARLIDSDGNVTNYSTSHEIVQFNIGPSDFKIRFGADGYKG